nr:immunoglobulin heavy chain junction region [Macaca mulatta]MOV47229.1 immunoglobulin heavy chain junction region [Macaca mulatta]
SAKESGRRAYGQNRFAVW